MVDHVTCSAAADHVTSAAEDGATLRPGAASAVAREEQVSCVC
jgi:hypothetical protein